MAFKTKLPNLNKQYYRYYERINMHLYEVQQDKLYMHFKGGLSDHFISYLSAIY